MVKLDTVLKAGYKDKKYQEKTLGKEGYVIDKKLSTGNEQVYYNPQNKDLLVNVTGTHNFSDIGTDVYLAFGGLKKTNRYKEADKVLQKAKAKYDENKVIVTADSLGGSILQGIAKKTDKVYTYNAGYTIGQKTKGGNQQNFRNKGDLVSLLGAGSKNLHTLNTGKSIGGSFLNSGVEGVVKNAYTQHVPTGLKTDIQLV
jgi:hypothetical protein